MKTIVNYLSFALLAVVGSSCKNQQADNTTDSGYQEYGYYASDSGPQQSSNSNPYATDSSAGSYQQSAPQDNDYVNVTQTTPHYSGGSTQMPANQDSLLPVPSQQPAPTYGDTSSPSVGLASTHTVSQGETLYRISKIYGSTVEGIKSVNGLNTDIIHPGDVLSIP